MIEAESLTIPLKSINLQVERLTTHQGNNKPTLVFLHDALGSIPQWKIFPRLLAKKCGLNAVIFDRQGHGKSSPFSSKRDELFLHHEALEVLPKVLDELNIEHPILVGHSDGGSIALIYGANFHPKAVISIAAHIFVEEITLAGIRQAGKLKKQLVPLLEKYHGDKTEVLFDAWQEIWLSDEFRDWSIEEEIKTISCPVLAIQGDKDEYGTEAQVQRMLAAVAGPKQAFMVPDTKHLPHLEVPELLIGEIELFLNDGLILNSSPQK